MNIMAVQGTRGGGQRSKGPRKFVGSRIPMHDADILPAATKLIGLDSVSDFVAIAVSEKLASMDLSNVCLQEELPIGQIAS